MLGLFLTPEASPAVNEKSQVRVELLGFEGTAGTTQSHCISDKASSISRDSAYLRLAADVLPWVLQLSQEQSNGHYHDLLQQLAAKHAVEAEKIMQKLLS